MSDLIAVAYPDRYNAEAVRETLIDLIAQRTIELEDAVVVTRDEEGNVKLTRRFDRRPQALPAGCCGGA